MKTNTVYTLLSLCNLVVFTILIGFLPEIVPVAIEGGVVSAVGSGWWLVSFPAAAALLSIGVWLISLNGKSDRRWLKFVLILLGCVFSSLGWGFYSIVQSGGQLGAQIGFPYGAIVVYPLCMLAAIMGGVFYNAPYESVFAFSTPKAKKSEEAWRKINRFAGGAYLVGSLFAAILAVLFACLNLSLVSALVFALCMAAATAASFAYSATL